MKTLKVYIAARATTRLEDVKIMQRKLVELGYSIAYDWANEDMNIARPYRHRNSRELNSKAITKMLGAAADADVFVLLDEIGLRGAYIEYGAFLHEALKHPKKKKVFIVGPKSHQREHIFESPDFVHFVDTVEDVYTALTTPKSASTDII